MKSMALLSAMYKTEDLEDLVHIISFSYLDDRRIYQSVSLPREDRQVNLQALSLLPVLSWFIQFVFQMFKKYVDLFYW